MRRPLFMANWKMHMSPSEARVFKATFEGFGLTAEADIVICPAFPALEAAQSDHYLLGAQNLHPEKEGAFTGEVSGAMLTDLGIRYVLVGHSERRALMGEDDDVVCEKYQAAVEAGLTPVLCIGEDMATRAQGEALSFCRKQLEAVLSQGRLADDLVIAYEPVWAIGSGQSAAPEDAQEILAGLRQALGQEKGAEVADRARFLYGGSVNRSNIAAFMAQADLDGVLVGGASLDPAHFADLVRFGRGPHGQ